MDKASVFGTDNGSSILSEGTAWQAGDQRVGGSIPSERSAEETRV